MRGSVLSNFYILFFFSSGNRYMFSEGILIFNFIENGATIVHKHTRQAKTNSNYPRSRSTKVSNLKDRPKRWLQCRNTSSCHIPEDIPKSEHENNQNSQRKAPTLTKGCRSSIKTTGDDYPRNQGSSIGTEHRGHHPRSNSRTPHSIRLEDGSSIP